MTGAGGKVGKVQTAREAQEEHGEFTGAMNGLELLDVARGQFVRGYGGFPFAQVWTVLPAPALHVRRRRRTQADVAVARPITKVVQAFLSGRRVITHFVRRDADRAEPVTREVEHLQLDRLLH